MENRSWYTPYLLPGEVIRWQGRPAMHFPHSMIDGVAALALFGMVLLHLCLTQMEGDEPPEAIVLTIGVMALVDLGALYLGGSTFLLRPWLIRHTEYAVTDRRILRRRGGTVDSMLLAGMPEPRLERHEDGRATIRFAPEIPPFPPEHTRRATADSRLHFHLDHIDDADEVLALLRSLRDSQEAPALPAPDLSYSLLPVDRDENVLWQGRPKMRLTDVLPPVIVMAGVLWTGLAVWTRCALQATGHLEQWWLLPEAMLQVGTFLLIERGIRMAWRCAHGAYVVTDRRVICQWGKKTDSMPLANCPNVFLAEDRRGLGTLVITSGLGKTTCSMLLRGMENAVRRQELIVGAIRKETSL